MARGRVKLKNKPMPRIPTPFRRGTPPPPPEPVEEGHELRMGLFEHLEELRSRLFKAALALIFGTIIGIGLASPTLEYLQQPYCEIVGSLEECRLNTLGPTEGVVIYFRVSLLVGGIIAIPVMTYQVLMFIIPGLTRREKRFILLSIPAITLLFLAGSAFAWFVLMRPALGFLEGFQPTIFKPEWTADLYTSFITALIFWMGVAFQTPLIFFVLSLLGLVSARPLLRNWRVAVVASAIAAALITPTIDPVNMFLVMGPLLVLYAISIILVLLGRRITRIDA